MKRILITSCLLVGTLASRPARSGCEIGLRIPPTENLASNFKGYWPPAVWSKITELRNVKRRGWLKRGIPEVFAEDVYHHTIKVSRAAEIIASVRTELDRKKIIKMALIHDLAELIAGDIIPSDGVASEQKFLSERRALESFVRQDPMHFTELFNLWLNFENVDSEEARLLKQLDKLDPAIQAIRYARAGYATADFYGAVLSQLSDPLLKNALKRALNAPLDEDPYSVYFNFLIFRR